MKTLNAQDAKSKIINFLASHPNSDAKAIETGTSIPRAIVFSTIKELASDKQVSTFQKGMKSVKLFSVVTMPSVEKARAIKASENTPEVVPAPEGKNYGRDFSKYEFNGKEYRKGKLIHAGIQDVVKRINPTFKQLHEMLPDDLVRNYGVFTEAPTARKMNNSGKQRYHTQADMLLKLKCGTVVAVTNQIGSNNIDPIIQVLRANGCVIKEPTI